MRVHNNVDSLRLDNSQFERPLYTTAVNEPKQSMEATRVSLANVDNSAAENNTSEFSNAGEREFDYDMYTCHCGRK